MYKNILLIASLSIFTVACSQKTEEKIVDSSTLEKKSDSTSAEDDNAGYEVNAEVTSAKNWDLLIPDGFVLLDKASGDINNDGIEDMILAVKSQQEKDEELIGEEAPERKLILLLKDSEGNYSVAAENSNAILRKNMGGAGSDDPYQSITTKPGQFSITHMGGSTERWTYRHTFAYDKANNAWFLSTIEQGDFDADNPTGGNKTTETPKKFGKINFTDFKGI